MFYVFPYVRRVLVELRKDNPDVKPKSRRRWTYRNRFWRKYGPAITLWIRRAPVAAAARPCRRIHFLPAAGARARGAERRDLAARPDHQLSARSRPFQISLQHVGLPRAGLLRHPRGLLRLSRRLTTRDRLSLRPADRRLLHRARTAGRSCPIAGTGRRSRSIRPRPAARNGRSSSRSTTSSAATAAACRSSTRRRS